MASGGHREVFLAVRRNIRISIINIFVSGVSLSPHLNYRNMRKLFYATLLLFSLDAASAQQAMFHDYIVRDIDGRDFPLSQLRGKKVMVVNVASRCGLTPQYENLQALYENYGPDDFVIIAFPANDFMEQEPGTDSEIAAFCDENYGITFPLMSKITVKGDETEPLYQWLTRKDLNGVEDVEITWNFQKFLIDEKGNMVRSVPPLTPPDDAEIIEWIMGSQAPVSENRL